MFRNRQYKVPRANQGQSTVEYILVVTAVIAVIIAMINPFKNKLGNAFEQSQNGINSMADKMSASHNDTIEDKGPQMNVDATEDNPVADNLKS